MRSCYSALASDDKLSVAPMTAGQTKLTLALTCWLVLPTIEELANVGVLMQWVLINQTSDHGI